MKRALVIILCLVIVFSMMAGCTQKDDPENQTTKAPAGNSDQTNSANEKAAGKEMDPRLEEIGFTPGSWPLVEKQIKVVASGMTHSTLLGSADDWDKNKFWVRLEERTNIDFEWLSLVQGGKAFTEQMNLAFASGNIPDIFFKCRINPLDELKYGREGGFIPLEGYIAEYMPNLNKLFKEYPEIRKSLTTPDGHIYTLPEINVDPVGRVTTNIMVNRVWMEKLGINDPETIDDFYNMLVAFRDEDPNENGKADEIPLCVAETANVAQLVSLFGYQLNIDNMFLDEELDEIVFVPTQDGFKDFLKFMNKLYKEKLLDNEFVTLNNDQIKAKGSMEDSILGVVRANSPGLQVGGLSQVATSNDLTIEENNRRADYKAMIPIKAPNNGRQLVLGSTSTTPGKFAITPECEYPEVIMSFMDFFYTEEGGTYVWAGEEESEYAFDDKGKFQWLLPDGSYATADKHNDVRKTGTLQPGGHTPGYRPEFKKHFDGPVRKIKESVVEYARVPSPSFYFEEKNVKNVGTITADVKPYVEQFIAKAIVGELDVDTEWDSYVKTLKQMGLDDLIKIYNDAYDLYKQN